MLARMTYSTKLVLFAIVFSQMFSWNFWNCTAHGEAEPLAEEDSKSTDGKGETGNTCNGPYFRELCTIPGRRCCFYDGKTHTCRAEREEDEECTHDAMAYTTTHCFCKKGLYCINSKCSSKVPTDIAEKFAEIYDKR